MKIRPVGAEMFYADRQIDMSKLTVAFRNFANAPKNVVSATPKLLNANKINYRVHTILMKALYS
jgi:hypothetical protein